MPQTMNQPLAPVPPRPYPRCNVCSALMKEWLGHSEPASVTFDRGRAREVAMEINDHRRQDENSAPAL